MVVREVFCPGAGMDRPDRLTRSRLAVQVDAIDRASPVRALNTTTVLRIRDKVLARHYCLYKEQQKPRYAHYRNCESHRLLRSLKKRDSHTKRQVAYTAADCKTFCTLRASGLFSNVLSLVTFCIHSDSLCLSLFLSLWHPL
jgi:hypothetical protein